MVGCAAAHEPSEDSEPDSTSSAPIATTPAWSIAGTPEDGLGFGDPAGDVNGDGYADMIVGAPGWHRDTGRAKLYFGSTAGLSSTPTMIVPDEPTGYFGGWATGVGDVNGDGYDEVIVGEYNGDFLLYEGSSSGLVEAPIARLSALRAYPAGDVNGDGYADVLVWPDYLSMELYLGSAEGLAAAPASVIPSPDWNTTASDLDLNGDGYSDVVMATSSVLSVYLGGADGLSSEISSEGALPDGGGTFHTVESAGDVNGDGYDDLLTGPGRGVGCVAYLYLGFAEGIIGEPSTTFLIPEGSDYVGDTVAAAGDLNADGYDDVVLTTQSEDWTGRASVYLGSSEGLPETAETTRGIAGSTVDARGAGDLNGDGYADMVVSWFGADMYVYLGDEAGIAEEASPTIYGERGDTLGLSVSGGGDFNGDGYDDVLVGADGAEVYRGEVQVYAGSEAGLPQLASETLTGREPTSMFGYSVAAAGDVNGDGFGDAVIGSYYIDEVEVFLGSPDGLQTRSRSALPRGADWENEGFFGRYVAGLGDVNGDGRDDVAVGGVAVGDTAWRAYVYYGDALTPLSAAPTLLTGEVEQPYDDDYVNTNTVAGVGDLNGDGLAELAVGTEEAPVPTVYIFDGAGDGITTTPSTTISGVIEGRFGSTISAAGDVNGDGYRDLAIGADARTSDGANGGVVLCFGAWDDATTCSSPIVEDAHVWYYVTGAGDLDGDGFDDLAIGGTDYDGDPTMGDSLGPDAWEVSVFVGSPLGAFDVATQLSGPWTDTTASGTSALSAYRFALSSAGDVNGDSHADLLVGAPQENWGGGAAFLYLGQ